MRVDDGGDFDVVDAAEALEMFLTAAIDAHHRDANTFIGADDASRNTPACVDGQTRGHQGLEKHATGLTKSAHSEGSSGRRTSRGESWRELTMGHESPGA
jgi:hypothetical protein